MTARLLSRTYRQHPLIHTPDSRSVETVMKKNRAFSRRLNLESLEERRLLAVLLVDDDFSGNDATAGKFTTIQAAVTAAVAGDQIKVRPGTYAENVVITKQLKIVGAQASLDDAHDDSEVSIVDPGDSD